MEITTDQSAQPKFIKSIDDLAAFSAAVDVFKRRFDDLQNHIESIQNAIDSSLKSNGVDLSTSCSSPDPPLSPPRNNASGEATAIVSQLPREAAETVPETSNKPEVQRMCEFMWSKGLRRYIQVNISDRAKLISEIPAALKFAKDPAKLVLECMGKFYLQGRKAFTKGSTIVSVRQVSLLILESLLLMPDPGEGKLKLKIGSAVKDQAEKAAVAWRKRLLGEGGIAAAQKMDARGLLLLIACFGVPSKFRSTDLLDLIRKSGSSEIAGALRRSPFLVPIPMISGIVESSIKRGMHIEALEMVYTFELEDSFSASSILTAFLKMNKESFERAKQKAQSPMAFKEANEKQLAALSSVKKCMENHKLDPAKEIPEWQIKEQMVKLEEDTLHLKKEMEDKARSISLMEEAEVSKRSYKMKRPRLSPPMEMPPVASSSYTPIYYDRSIPSRRDEDNDEISALVNSYLGLPSSLPHRSNLRRSPEYMVPPGGVSAYEHLPSNSYSSVHGQRLTRQYSPAHGQRLPQQHSPPFHGQQQIPIGLQSVYSQSPPVERYLGLPNHRSRSPHNSSLDRIGRI